MTDELLWLAGRYLGDGWTRLTDTRAELVITCGMHEVDRLRDLLSRWPRAGARSITNELAWHERSTRTAYQFTTNHRGLVDWLRAHFGHRAEAKGVPAWALGLSIDARESLLEGYLSADGHKFEDFTEAHTVSKSLAFGIKALANSLGKTVAVYCRPNTNVIEGRVVNPRDLFKVRWRHDVHADHAQTYIENNIEWCPVREQSDVGETASVFNIGAEEDESYVVEGIIVHNCKHFSKAKGGKPVSKKIRSLAWVVVKWATLVKPRMIFLENVEEFQTWGPLGADNRPCPKRKGRTFKTWKHALEKLGYVVEHRELRACDYGTPTTRKRLFLIARMDGQPIVWPQPTHGAPDSLPVQAKKLLPWRTAADCIEWDIPAPSIFTRKKPLADATNRRIAKGVMRYVVDSNAPFIVKGSDRNMVPTLIQTGYGERPGQAPRVPGLEKPLGTVVNGQKHALVSAFLAKHYTGVVGSDMAAPLGTVTTIDHHSYVTENLIHMGHGEGKDGTKRFSHGIRSLENPLNTVTASGVPGGLVMSSMCKLRGENVGSPTDTPIHTISAQGTHHAEVRTFLTRFYGGDQPNGFSEDAGSEAEAQNNLVTIDGELYSVNDIGLRMLTPRELYRAQGFPESYQIDKDADGKPLTKKAQVRMCGNSVCPPLASALVSANYRDILLQKKVA